MKKVKQGDQVTIEYVGMLEDGETVESSEATGPFEMEVGSNVMPPGFENALIGMTEGEEKTVVLQPEEAFGHKDENLLHKVNNGISHFQQSKRMQASILLINHRIHR